MILPGWGQLASRRPVMGWTLIASTLAALAVTTAVFFYLGPVEIAARLAHPDVLAGMLALNLVLAVARLAVTTHAWRSRGGRG
ncbi:MAG: hypothetical protein ACLFWM_10370 [Actinomycetota bacterium]